MLDEAVSYVPQDSRHVAERLLIQALEAASSLDTFSDRGRIVPELNQPNVRQLLVQRYRLLYEVTPAEVYVLAFVHGAGPDRPDIRILTIVIQAHGGAVSGQRERYEEGRR